MKNITPNPRANGSVFLHLRFSLLFFILIGVLTNASAQVSPVFTCGTPNPSVVRGSQNNLPSLRSACTDRNITKYVSVNVQFILKSDGTGNYNETSDGLGGSVSGYQAAYELIRTANELLANNPKVYQPIGNSTPIPAVRIQYVLKGVYFIRNTTVYNYNDAVSDFYDNGLFDNLNVNSNSEMNIFIAGISIGPSGIARQIGLAPPRPPSVLIGDQMWNSYNQGYTKTVFYQSTPILFKWFYYAEILTHELGHLMNLYHPFVFAINPDNDGCTDTYTLAPRSFEPIPPQTNPFNGQSCPTAQCTNTFMEGSLNHYAVTPCQKDRMHTELESTNGRNYYDCTCLSPVPSFTFLPSSNYTIYGDYIFLNCDQPGVYIPINIDASATQYENAYEVTVEEVTTGTSYTKMYYGTASTINLQYIFPNMQVNRVYRIRLNAINTCSKQYTEKFINVQYNIGCGGFFLRASPNPASQTITIDYGIEVEKETDTELWMTEFNNPSKQNIIKTKSKQSKGTYQEQINVNGLKNGIYLVTLKTPEKSISQKVEILH